MSQRIHSMYRCPIELWQLIAAFACTDGGRTGCALSLVSHAMRSAVEPVRYHSVSLVGQENVFAFAERLAQMDNKPTIRHLFISFTKSWTRLDETGLPDTAALLQELDDAETSGHHRDNRRTDAMRTIFESCAHSLYTLAALVHDLVGFDPEKHKYPVFPLLHDLIIDSIYEHCDQYAYKRFPSLRRLHIVGAWCNENLWLNIACIAPRLTHLKISGLHQDPGMSRLCEVILGYEVVPGAPLPADSGEGIAPFDASLARTQAASEDKTQFNKMLCSRMTALQYIYAEPEVCRCNESLGWWDTRPSINHANMLAALERLARASAESTNGRRLFVVPATEIYAVHLTLRDWLKAVEGNGSSWPEDLENSVATPCTSPSLFAALFLDETGLQLDSLRI